MGAVKEYFTREYIGSLDKFNLQLRTKLHGGYTGARKSRTKGSSQEFSDFRPYTIGDDLRSVDWNSYARLDRLFVKQFMEEKQAAIHIFIDTSRSMEYGTPTKGMIAKILAGSLSYIGVHNMDRVSIYPYGDRITSQSINLQSKNRFSGLIHYLDSLQTEEKTSLNQTLRQISKRKIDPGISIILSDFFFQDGYEEGLKTLQEKKQDITLVQVLAKEETNPDFIGNIRIVDLETKNHKDMDLSKEVIEQYQKELGQYINQIKLFCQRRGIIFKQFTTEQSILQMLYESLAL